MSKQQQNYHNRRTHFEYKEIYCVDTLGPDAGLFRFLTEAKKYQFKHPGSKIHTLHIDRVRGLALDFIYQSLTRDNEYQASQLFPKELWKKGKYSFRTTNKSKMFECINKDFPWLFETFSFDSTENILKEAQIDKTVLEKKIHPILSSTVFKSTLNFLKPKDQKSFLNFLTAISQKSDLVDFGLERPYCFEPITNHRRILYGELSKKELLPTLARIFVYRKHFLRKIELWTGCNSGDARMQFHSLISHLFCRYDIPPFFNSLWFWKHDEIPSFNEPAFLKKYFSIGRGVIDIFIELGKTGNTKKALERLPLPSSQQIRKRMLEMKDQNHSYLSAYIFAYLATEKLDKTKDNLETGITILDGIADLENCLTVFQNPYLIRSFLKICIFSDDAPGAVYYNDEVSDILDYLIQKSYPDFDKHSFMTKFKIGLHLLRWRFLGGKFNLGKIIPLKKFEFHKKNFQALQDDVLQWHEEFDSDDVGDKSWKAHGLGLKLGSDYEVIEITKEKDLFEEGHTMHHCVYSYLSECLTRDIAICSLRKNGASLVTIEVNTEEDTIRQCKMKYNQSVGKEEDTLISKWAKEKGLMYLVALKMPHEEKVPLPEESS